MVDLYTYRNVIFFKQNIRKHSHQANHTQRKTCSYAIWPGNGSGLFYSFQYLQSHRAVSSDSGLKAPTEDVI